MSPIRSRKNQYRGINAHLHSLLQTSGGWEGFHTNHIADLTRLLQVQLIPMGYEADIEQSLQIRRIGESTKYPKSDVTIYDPDPVRQRQPAMALQASTGELVLPIPALLNITEDELEYYKAIAIYKTSSGRQERGEPVVWIELLSPSNKPPHRDFEHYREKRTDVLQTGMVFVEIDYLHQSPSTFEALPNYYTQPPEPDAHPYRITVIEPRPDFYEGQGRSRQFKVDDLIPRMRIPLSDDDVLEFNFSTPYQKTFEEMFYGNKVDYRQLPLNFETYSIEDRARIVARMLSVLSAVRDGIDIEQNAPLPVQPISLEDGLAQLQTFPTT
jgi:hypothetical protein